jgi:hypothetical protein
VTVIWCLSIVLLFSDIFLVKRMAIAIFAISEFTRRRQPAQHGSTHDQLPAA